METYAPEYSVSLYACPQCDGEESPQPPEQFDHFDGEVFCRLCGHTCVWVDDTTADYVSVAVYSVMLCYGGPEEGGWHYLSGAILPETLRNFGRGDFPQIEAYKSTLRRRFVGDGWQEFEIRTYGNQIAPVFFPDRRPHYS